MTRKDYELQARIVRLVKQFVEQPSGIEEYDKGKYDTLYVLATQITVLMQADNPRFDAKLFFEKIGGI